MLCSGVYGSIFSEKLPLKYVIHSADRMAPTAEPEPSIIPTLAASASANSLARIPCHPIDTVKAKLQVQGKSCAVDTAHVSGGPISALRTVLRTEGIGGLYSGIGITVLGVRI